jgi:nicotinamidase/pyrazinamidase
MKHVVLTPEDALIVVDIQNDFLPGGRLAVPYGDEIIDTVNCYVERFLAAERPVFATRDLHPPDHCSFLGEGGPWPCHCVAGTHGAAFPQALKLPDAVRIVSKAHEKDKEAYSAFSGTTLDEQLKRLAVRRLFICGLATEYCVFNTAKDAIACGYTVFLLQDAIRAIDAQPNDGNRAIEQMKEWGVEPITVRQILSD